jgi:hypothetical protein
VEKDHHFHLAISQLLVAGEKIGAKSHFFEVIEVRGVAFAHEGDNQPLL